MYTENLHNNIYEYLHYNPPVSTILPSASLSFFPTLLWSLDLQISIKQTG